MRTVSFRLLFLLCKAAGRPGFWSRQSYTVTPLLDIQVGSVNFGVYVFFFWYGLTTSMTFSQALGFPIHLNLATNKIPMFFLIAWLRKDRKKLELDTHTHTQILWMEEVLQQLGFINHVSKHMVETCQQNMHPNKIPQERFFHVFARCAWLNSLLWWIDVGHSIQCTIPRLSTQMIKGPYKKTYPIP